MNNLNIILSLLSINCCIRTEKLRNICNISFTLFEKKQQFLNQRKYFLRLQKKLEFIREEFYDLATTAISIHDDIYLSLLKVDDLI